MLQNWESLKVRSLLNYQAVFSLIYKVECLQLAQLLQTSLTYIIKKLFFLCKKYSISVLKP